MADAARPAWVDDELFPFESRCVALDYPGFGLTSARPGYQYLYGRRTSPARGDVRREMPREP